MLNKFIRVMKKIRKNFYLPTMLLTAIGYVVYCFVYPFVFDKLPDAGDAIAIVALPVFAMLLFAKFAGTGLFCQDKGMVASSDKKGKPGRAFGYWEKSLFLFYVVAVCKCVSITIGSQFDTDFWLLLVNIGLALFAALLWQVMAGLHSNRQ